jgi:O-succinylbenzoate synthase
MRIDAVRLVRFGIPLRSPFRTSFGTQTERDVILVHVVGPDSEGWGENVAGEEPTYSPEFVAASELVLRDHLVPRLLAVTDVHAADVARLLDGVRGWEMAKCALEAALLDAELRAAGVSLQQHLGGTRARIAVGVSVGIHDEIDQTLHAVERYLADGYTRVKLKIEPGHDVELVGAVRARFGPELLLQVDANAAYTLDDAAHLAELDAFGLLLIEQPLVEGDLLQHAKLAQRLHTPICLDESITSWRVARDAIELGACSIINIKPGRVGGYLEAKRIHDLCVDHGIPVWCGGMLETGVGRAANLALASLPGFTLPPDLSASRRYFEADVTPEFSLVDGCLEVPSGPGIGVAPTPERLVALGATAIELRR